MWNALERANRTALNPLRFWDQNEQTLYGWISDGEFFVQNVVPDSLVFLLGACASVNVIQRRAGWYIAMPYLGLPLSQSVKPSLQWQTLASGF
jgi:hypothetical protein